MPTLILDPHVERQLQDMRQANGISERDEVWAGVTIVMPLPNLEHQRIVAFFMRVFGEVFPIDGSFLPLPGANVSDQIEDWKENYREPDVLVVREGGNALDCDTHLYGGPEFVVEVVSLGDRCRDKLPFYASIGTKEVLIVDRNPWQVELYQLRRGKLRLAGIAKPSDRSMLKSAVVPLSFSLVRGKPRPKIRITHTDDGREWTF